MFKMNRFNARYLLMLIPVAGIAVSIWAAITNVAVMSQTGKIACDVSDLLSCSKVIGSAYGSLFNVPLGYWGISFWLCVLGLYLLPLFYDAGKKTIALARLVFGGTGLIVALTLASISIFKLHTFCIICETLQILCILFFIFTLLDFIKLKNAPLAFQKKTIVIGILVLIPLLIVPLIAGSIIASLTHIAGPSFASAEEAFKKLDKDVFYQEKGLHSLGPKYARVTLTVYTDFECSWCQKLHSMLFDEVNKSGVKDILVVFKNYPLAMHPSAKNIALAARCAGRQGKFWEFANWAFEAGSSKIKGAAEAAFSKEGLANKAESLGIDKNQFMACYNSKEEMPQIDAEMKEGEKHGLKGTPFILMNDKPYKAIWSEPGRLSRDIRVAAGLEKDTGDSLFNYQEEPRLLWSYLVPFYTWLLPIAKVETYRMFESKKENVTSIILRNYGLMIMLMVDNNGDGKPDEFNWVMGNLRDVQKSQLLYNETMLPELRTRTWYGPGNIKMIAQEDMDKNGAFETTVYYNENARKGVQFGKVARFESDTNGDGKPDVWAYPVVRMEMDKNFDGVPDAITTNQKDIQNNLVMIEKGVKLEKFAGWPLAPTGSWALHPELIDRKENKAMIPYTYPGVVPDK